VQCIWIGIFAKTLAFNFDFKPKPLELSLKPDDANMTNVFVYSGIAITADTIANHPTPNLAHILCLTQLCKTSPVGTCLLLVVLALPYTVLPSSIGCKGKGSDGSFHMWINT